jgi:hypothetical protein
MGRLKAGARGRARGKGQGARGQGGTATAAATATAGSDPEVHRLGDQNWCARNWQRTVDMHAVTTLWWLWRGIWQHLDVVKVAARQELIPRRAADGCVHKKVCCRAPRISKQALCFDHWCDPGGRGEGATEHLILVIGQKQDNIRWLGREHAARDEQHKRVDHFVRAVNNQGQTFQQRGAPRVWGLAT